MIILLLKPRKQRKRYPTKCFVYRFFFSFCVNGTHSFMAIVARYFMSADFTSHDIWHFLTSVTNQIGLGISFQNLNLLRFDQIISLKSLLINICWWGSGSKPHRRHCVQRERERERERERKRERKKAVKTVLESICWALCCRGKLFKWCRNLSACTVLQGCSCLSSVAT